MGNMIQSIMKNREPILLGEIGALLHDIGKFHPDFIRRESIEKIGDFKHEDIDSFLDNTLIGLIQNSRFAVKIDDETNIYSIIREHHTRKSKKNLIKLLKSCDRMDSADDKGIVREKQSIDDTFINSPFGYPKERINLRCLEYNFDDLSDYLTGLFNKYISNSIQLSDFRESVIICLNSTFVHALGETRIPSNDVTLWDHSHSTASLFKSVLCSIALGEKPKEKNLKWRIFGFCWNGTAFTNKGKKVHDILERKKIIDDIKEELKRKFEYEIPIGNVIYEDTDGIYFTFPDLNASNSKELAEEIAKIGLMIIKGDIDNENGSDGEISPFFIISEPSRTLTVLAHVLTLASTKMNIPKMTPTLFFGENSEKKIGNNPDMPATNENQDICPVCQFRSKPAESESCGRCSERKKGRIDNWLSERKHTVWMDEVADENNRVALLALRFDLDRWFDGTVINTLHSQTFEDWSNSERAEEYFRKYSIMLYPRKKEIYKLLSKFLNLVGSDNEQASQILATFFESIMITKGNVETHKKNIEQRINSIPFDCRNLASYLFTQNPSPARLFRIWEETSEFSELVIKKIKENIYFNEWKRISFSIDISKLKFRNKYQLKNRNPYVVKIQGLTPENLLIFHSSEGVFYTIESLRKFSMNSAEGSLAVETALKKPIIYLAEEDYPDKNLLENGQSITAIDTESYFPVIEITKSPISLQLIIPASDSIKILELITKLYNERFAKVIGKLPLNAGLLVSKRKFPLYVLLNAGERILKDKIFREPIIMEPYWEISEGRFDKYYRFYPTRKAAGDKSYTLDDIEPLSKGKLFALYPGYFDFELLTDTTSRYTIVYNEGKRADENYRMLSARPIYFYQISQLIDLWEIVSNNLSSSQRMFVEEFISSKVLEWGKVSDPQKKTVFREFVEAVLRDAFAERWNNLKKETQDFLMYSAVDKRLLDTLMLFRHIVKAQEADEDGNEIC